MWKNQKGFSLIEVILVIALIAVLVSSSVSMFGHIRYANTKKVAEEVDNALSRLRLDTMSGDDQQYLYIYQLNGGYYMMVMDNKRPVVGTDGDLNGNGTRLCGTNVTFSYDTGKTVGENSLKDYDYIRVAYRKNGVFRFEDATQGIIGTNTKSITISGGGTFTICLDDETGRHYIE